MVKALGLLALLALPPVTARAEMADTFASKPLQLRDPAQELREAEKAVSRGEGADAYAARADAKRSLGRPFEDYAADYAEAARRDPRKYGEKFRGILDQEASETRHERKKYRHTASAGGRQADVLAAVMFLSAMTVIVVIAGLVLIRGRSGAP